MGSSMSTAHSMEVENVPVDALSEILRRVEPHPASLVRASLACKALRRFISQPDFLRTFKAHHRSTPPLLGFFHDEQNLPHNFLPIGNSPDRVPAAAFDPKEHGWHLVDSRHGRVLLRSPGRARFLVWDPVAGRRRYINAPPAMQHAGRYMLSINNAAVVCAGAAPGHVDVDHHSDCHDCPFSVVFVGAPDAGTTAVHLFSSELGLWNEVASADLSSLWIRITDRPVALVRNVLYWTMASKTTGLQSSILAFDLQTHRLSLIQQPTYIFDAEQENVQVMETEDGRLGLVAACGLCLQLWVLQEYDGRSGTERWSMIEQIDLHDLALDPEEVDPEEYYMVWILSVEGGVVFVRTEAGIFEVDLWTDEVAPRRICDAYDIQAFYPYKSFYYQRGTGGPRDGANGQS